MALTLHEVTERSYRSNTCEHVVRMVPRRKRDIPPAAPYNPPAGQLKGKLQGDQGSNRSRRPEPFEWKPSEEYALHVN